MSDVLWEYRNFIIASVKREFQSQYSKSILGAAWIIMNPLYMSIIYSAIFSSVMAVNGNKFAYTIYVASGLLAWNLFIDIFNRSQSIYINNANVMKHQRFPHLCLPIIVLLIAWIDFTVSFGLFAIFLSLIGQFPGWSLIALLPIIIIQSIYAIGLATILGVLNLFFRDIGRALIVLLQIWFWLTPVVYFIDRVPKNMQHLLQLNPMTPFVMAYQSVLSKQEWPQWDTLLYPIFVTLLTGIFLMRFYNKHAVEILDEL